MRKCLTVKGSLQDIQKGGCSLVSKYACVNLVCPILHLVILVWICKSHYDIQNGYLFMGRAKLVLKLIKGTELQN